MYTTDLDYNTLEKSSEEDFLKYIYGNFIAKKYLSKDNYKFNIRYNVLTALCKLLKITPSREQWAFLLTDVERMLCEACAGAGKTTMAQLKLIDEKLTHNTKGKNILALAYNTHAVKDMSDRHEQIISKLNSLKIPSLKRDTDLCCFTFHSFCLTWVMEFNPKYRGKSNTILDDGDTLDLIRLVVGEFVKRTNSKIFFSDNTYLDIISLYNFSRETCTEDNADAWKLSTAYQELISLGLTVDNIKMIFTYFTNLKRIKDKLDFTDILSKMYDICKNPDYIRRIRGNYSVFLVDEYQDITPAMTRILRQIIVGDENIPPYKDSKLICIGDGDQSIYGFRGTDSDNCLRFRQDYTENDLDVRVLSMSENRRCPDNIITVAREVIESNNKRIFKPIKSIKDGGDITVVTYSDYKGQYESLLMKLKMIEKKDLDNTCICYRNLSSSYYLTLTLSEMNIPYRIGRGFDILEDKVSKTILDALQLLSSPDSLVCMSKVLFKLMPKSKTFNKKYLEEVYEKETVSRRSTGIYNRFWEILKDPSVTGWSEYSDTIKKLYWCYVQHRQKKKLNEYVPTLMDLAFKYYLKWQLSKGNSLPEEYSEYLNIFFNQNITYSELLNKITQMKDNQIKNKDKGIYLTSFHGLKGLEFKNMFVLDLNENIFPGTDLRRTDGLNPQQIEEIESETRRLFYVVLTRAKENIYLYFDEENPTRFMKYVTVTSGIANTYHKYISDESSFTQEDNFILSKVGTESDIIESDEDITLDELLPDEELSDEDTLLAGDYTDIVSAAFEDDEHNEESAGKFENKEMLDNSVCFMKIFEDEESIDSKLKETLDEKNYSIVKDKPNLKSVLDYLS